MKKFIRWIGQALLSVGRGDILLKMGLHRYLPHIVVAFLFCTLSIILSYFADNTLILRSQRMKELENVKILYNIKNGEMISLWRMTQVEDALEKMGSKVSAPQEPATELKK